MHHVSKFMTQSQKGSLRAIPGNESVRFARRRQIRVYVHSRGTWQAGGRNMQAHKDSALFVHWPMPNDRRTKGFHLPAASAPPENLVIPVRGAPAAAKPRTTSLSRMPAVPRAPVSVPPCAGSSTTMFKPGRGENVWDGTGGVACQDVGAIAGRELSAGKFCPGICATVAIAATKTISDVKIICRNVADFGFTKALAA